MKSVMPSEVNGRVIAPPSKSYTQRAIALALLAEGRTVLQDVSLAQDALTCMKIASSLGAKLQLEGKSLAVEPAKAPLERTLDCGESGLCLRMFSAIAALFPGRFVLTASKTLRRRPVDMIEKPLARLGVKVLTNNGFPPVEVEGPLAGGKVEVDGSLTSQFLTGLLIALPKAPEDSIVRVKNLKSKPYVEMTLFLVEKFGGRIIKDPNLKLFRIPGSQSYIGMKVQIEGDWSGASFLLVAGATAGKVEVGNLPYPSLQADSAIVPVLEKIGAKVKVKKDSIEVEKGELKPFRFNVENCPDLFPPLMCLAACCNGVSVITGLRRLKYKESSRAEVLYSEFKKLGVKIRKEEDFMEIEGGVIKGGQVSSHGDHRIAMAAAIAGINSIKGVSIAGWESIRKSYPSFFEDLKKIGVKIK